MTALSDLMTSWGSIYSNHAALRTMVAFVHMAALIIGGGIALAADRTTLIAYKLNDGGRRSQLKGLVGTHRIVLISLALIAVSGILFFASDFETYRYSRLFWAKMGLVALLLVNGALLWSAETRANRGDHTAWGMLRVTALASIALWLLTTLGGVALPNIG